MGLDPFNFYPRCLSILPRHRQGSLIHVYSNRRFRAHQRGTYREAACTCAEINHSTIQITMFEACQVEEFACNFSGYWILFEFEIGFLEKFQFAELDF